MVEPEKTPETPRWKVWPFASGWSIGNGVDRPTSFAWESDANTVAGQLNALQALADEYKAKLQSHAAGCPSCEGDLYVVTGWNADANENVEERCRCECHALQQPKTGS